MSAALPYVIFAAAAWVASLTLGWAVCRAIDAAIDLGDRLNALDEDSLV